MWDIPNYYYGSENAVKFEDFADAPNFFYMSGMDGSIVSFLFGGDTPEKSIPVNAEEVMLRCLDQDLLNRLKVVENDNRRVHKKSKKHTRGKV